MGGGGGGILQVLLTELSGLKKPRGFLNRHVRRCSASSRSRRRSTACSSSWRRTCREKLDAGAAAPWAASTAIYKVGYPSKAGRIRTYEGYLAKVKHDLTPEEVDRLATITPYATGATIKDLVNEALIEALQDGRETSPGPTSSRRSS